MFKLSDGRTCLYQWDLERQVIVNDPSVTEVHFCNRTDECSLVTEVIDGKANIPNILLQSSFDIRVFGYDGKATLHEKTFRVKPRTKPSDYVYEETAIKSFDELMKATELVDKMTSDFYEFVEDYSVGLADDGKGNVELRAVAKPGEGGDIDLSEYAKKTDIPTKVSELTNDAGYLTEHIDISGKADKEHTHSDFYTKTEIDNMFSGIATAEGGSY